MKVEVSYGANSLHHLASFSIAPSHLEHTTETIIVTDLYPEKLEGNEPEELEVVPWRLSDINGLLATGECTEAHSIAALFMAVEH